MELSRSFSASRAIVSSFIVPRLTEPKMIKGIQYSQRSILGNEEWRTTSCVSINDHEQSLYDIGFDIGALLEDIKVLMEAQNNSADLNAPSGPTLDSLIHRMVETDYALESWRDRLKGLGTGTALLARTVL